MHVSSDMEPKTDNPYEHNIWLRIFSASLVSGIVHGLSAQRPEYMSP